MRKFNISVIALAFMFTIGSLIVGFAQQGRSGGRQFQPGAQVNGDVPPPPPPMPPPPGGAPGGLHPRLLEQLNLSDAQKEQVRSLHESARTSAQQYFEQVRAADEQLRTITEAATFNEAQARQLLAAKSQAMTELEIIRLRTDSAVYNLLTAEQKASLEQLKQEFRPRSRGGRPEEMSPPN